MSLYHFHRVLITCTILFDVFFTVYCINKFRAGGGQMQIIMAVGSSLVTIGLIAYLIHFNRRMRIIRQLNQQAQ